jgi:hypothetical protein
VIFFGEEKEACRDILYPGGIEGCHSLCVRDTEVLFSVDYKYWCIPLVGKEVR